MKVRVILNAWCEHCSKPPTRIKHGGYFWKRSFLDVIDLLDPNYDDPNSHLILISRGGKETMVYTRSETYIPDENDLSVGITNEGE